MDNNNMVRLRFFSGWMVFVLLLSLVLGSVGIQQASAAFGASTRYQAETSNLANVTVASTNTGYSGSGYVTGFTSQWSQIGFDKSVSSSIAAKLDIRYANATGGTVTNLSLFVGSNKIQGLVLPVTASWSTWSTITVTFTIPAGYQNIRIKSETDIASSANIDYMDLSIDDGTGTPTPTPTATPTPSATPSPTPVPTIVVTPVFNPAAGTYASAQSVTISTTTSGATIRYTVDGTTPTTASTAYTSAISVASTKTLKAIAIKPGMTNSAVATALYTINTTTPTPTPTAPPVGTTKYEAENAALSGGAVFNNGNSGYSGTGFVEGYIYNANARTDFTVNVGTAGSRNITLHYSAGYGTVSSLDLIVNSITIRTLNLGGTGSWNSWADDVESINLNSGVNTISFKSNQSANNVANLDYLSIQADPVPIPGAFNQTAPVNGSTGVNVTPSFTWGSSSNAASYTLVVSTNSSFTSPAINLSGLTTNSYSPNTALSANTLYYWKVTAINASGSKLATNSGISFTTGAAPTPTPVPTATPTPAPTPTPVPGSTFYISPSGNDSTGTGTNGNPWKSLAYAAAHVPAGLGNTIYLKAGIYYETVATILPLGVNIQGAGESTTTVTSNGAIPAPGVDQGSADWKLWYEGTLIQLTSPGYSGANPRYGAPETMVNSANGNQTLSGFTIDGNNKQIKAGVWVENRNNVTMHHVTFNNLQMRGAVFGRSDMYWYIPLPDGKWMYNTTIYNCTFTNSGSQQGSETLGNLNIAGLDGADIYNITINDTMGYGIKFIFVGHYRNVKIHDTTINVNETDAQWGEKISIELWNLHYGNEVYNITCNTWMSFVNHAQMTAYQPVGTATNNLKVHHVRMVDQDGSSGKESIEAALSGVEIYDTYIQDKGFGIAIWRGGGSYELKNYIIRNNIFANVNRTPGFGFGNSAAVFVPDAASNIKIYNNVFDHMGNGLNLNSASGVDIKNNVFINTEGADVENGSGVTFMNNLKYHTNPQKASFVMVNGPTLGTGNILGLPGFKNTGNRWDTYYQSASASSLVVNNGVNVGLPYNGTAPDIGRWEN
ncbi:carbohydrate-binding protein [Paenibacillus psychroresistens]|uniref:Carbohydrate-binding protein n=1 Tax=Paenibacillus psychroresistens TaxID=1778678 RepID=A0A6B8RHV0_9BACL|nr:chitobiase/beta-hexosaminidase C-terminal domain-containing protein [Paenibacillus psychroresistens]QGQ95175.1 carbohydrate-binding protein [Paenibacillus psychroresistens]